MLKRSVPSISYKVADVPDPEPQLATHPGSSSSTDSKRAETLAGSIELTRQTSAVSLGGDTLAGRVELKRQGASHSIWDFEQVSSDSVGTGIFTGALASEARYSSRTYLKVRYRFCGAEKIFLQQWETTIIQKMYSPKSTVLME